MVNRLLTVLTLISITLSTLAQQPNAKKLAILEKAMQTTLNAQKPKPGEFYHCEVDGKATLAEFNYLRGNNKDYIFQQYDYQDKGLESHKWKLLWFDFTPAEDYFYYIHKEHTKSDVLPSELTNTGRMWTYNGDLVSALTAKTEKHTFFYPVPNIHWSGGVKNGFIDGEGAGIVCIDKEYKSWYCVEGTFKEGFPVGEVECRYIVLTKYLVPEKNDVFKVSLTEFVNGKATMTDSKGGMAIITPDGKGTLYKKAETAEAKKKEEAKPADKPVAKKTQDAPKVAKKGTYGKDQALNISIGNVSFNMVKVEGGSFMMGDASDIEDPELDDERPAHQVTLSTYYIGEAEVTQELWEAVMDDNPSEFKGAKRPVENVSWNTCQEFIQRLNKITGMKFRLPTEAEWEFAARGGKKSQSFRYSGSNDVKDVAWYKKNACDVGKDNPDYGSHDVKAKQANELGIYDMSGNVSEYCQDWKDAYTSSAQTNPKGPASGKNRVMRGGSWYFRAAHSKVTTRVSTSPGSKSSTEGLRLAL